MRVSCPWRTPLLLAAVWTGRSTYTGSKSAALQRMSITTQTYSRAVLSLAVDVKILLEAYAANVCYCELWVRSPCFSLNKNDVRRVCTWILTKTAETPDCNTRYILNSWTTNIYVKYGGWVQKTVDETFRIVPVTYFFRPELAAEINLAFFSSANPGLSLKCLDIECGQKPPSLHSEKNTVW